MDAYEELVEIYRAVSAREVDAGDFLRTFAEAFTRADEYNKAILIPAAFQLCVKYDLTTRYKEAEEAGRILKG